VQGYYHKKRFFTACGWGYLIQRAVGVSRYLGPAKYGLKKKLEDTEREAEIEREGKIGGSKNPAGGVEKQKNTKRA